MQAVSVAVSIGGSSPVHAQRKEFKSGSVGYFYSGKVEIEGVRHTLQVTMVEIGSKPISQTVFRVEETPDQIVLYTDDDQELTVPERLTEVVNNLASPVIAPGSPQTPPAKKATRKPRKPAATPPAQS